MIRKQKEREQEENKQSAFRLRGQEVNPEKIKRYLRDHPRPSNTDEDGDVNMDVNSAGKYPYCKMSYLGHLTKF